MRIIVSVYIIIILFCADVSAQNYKYVGLDIDSGLNLIRKANFDKKTKECVLISSTFLLTEFDDYNNAIFRTHFTKLDSNFNILLDKCIQLKNSSIRIRGSIKLKDGNYLGYGFYYNSQTLDSGKSNIEACLVKYNDSGDTIFVKKYPCFADFGEIFNCKQLTDESLVFVSLLISSNNSYRALRVVKLNTSFNIVWDSLYYYSNNSTDPYPAGYLDAIEETEDKGIIIGTSKYIYNIDSNIRALLFKLDSNGNFLWENAFYPTDRVYSGIDKIIKLTDGNYLCVGEYNAYYTLDPRVESHVLMLKVSTNGQILWQKLYKKFTYQYIYDVVETSSNKYILFGQSDYRSNAGSIPMATIFCVNSKGDELWSRVYENTSNKNYEKLYDSYFSYAEKTEDNRMLVLGNILTNDSRFPYNNGTDQDFIFLYSDSLGCIDPSNCSVTLVEHVPVEPKYFYVYPNPSSTNIHFSTNVDFTSESKLSIYNALGQLVHQVHNLTKDTSIELSTFSKGIYFVELQQGERYTERLVVE